MVADPGFFEHLWWWIEVHDGTVNEAGPYYGFWSGFGSDLGEYAIAGSIIGTGIATYRRHKCVTCPRLVLKHGAGKVEGTHFETCHKHTNVEDHKRLHDEHQDKYPEMHRHMNPTIPLTNGVTYEWRATSSPWADQHILAEAKSTSVEEKIPKKKGKKKKHAKQH